VKIIRFGVEQMIYVSCKTTSLVRDLEVLVVERVCCVDLFPGTPHCETVVLLSKLKRAQSIEVEIELDEMDLTKVKSKVTNEEINILDPAVGSGELLISMLRTIQEPNKEIKVVGYETDEVIGKQTQKTLNTMFPTIEIEIRNMDFLEAVEFWHL